MKTILFGVVLLVALPLAARSTGIEGVVTGKDGSAMEGVMVSVFDQERRQSVSVFSLADGGFEIDGLREAEFQVRARLMGQRDVWIDDVSAGTGDVKIEMEPAEGEELEDQRPASDAFGQLKFENMRDKLNFKMMCSYCHQIGTLGFRTPEKPVDWETMIMRMDGFGGLYRHTQETIVERIIDTYKDDAVKKWPKFVPPPAPTGAATKVKITAWEMDEPFEGSFHDLELGKDGLVYAVNISKHRTVTLDTATGEQKQYQLPRGSYAPHSIELGNDGHMWLTLCASGEMAKFDLDTKEYLICSGAEAPAKRGSYPHTLRINPKDPEGLIWYTDAGRNSVFSLHPETLKVKEYHLLKKNQAVAAGKGESSGITPYGLDYSPVDGMIWYSKLNGNRIGRIDPDVPDGDIKEWNPPFRGPRRLHVAQDGMVWVPGFASGVFGKFDPDTEEWTVYPLPDAENQIPYALNIDPKGNVWICGTGNDTLYRFNPKTEMLVEYRLPMRVSYTREIEFDDDGNVWTSTSGPARHMETACGAVIKLEVFDDESSGGIKLASVELSDDERGEKPPNENLMGSAEGKLLAKIDERELPAAYKRGKNHQVYVDKIMEGLPEVKRGRVGRLWQLKVELDPEMENRGWSFVRILDFVATEGKVEKPRIHRREGVRRSRYDAFAYANRIPMKAEEGESAEEFSGRVMGRLANQEGRVLLKLPPGMGREAYEGMKTFFRTEGTVGAGSCAVCHGAPGFGGGEVPSLRNLVARGVDVEAAVRAKTGGKFGQVKIGDGDVAGLVAFLGALNDVPDAKFRDLILKAEVLDTSEGGAVAPAVSGRVLFDGQRPVRQRVHMTPESAKLYVTPPLDESVIVAEDGAVANAFVYVKRGVEAKDYPMPESSALVDQERSMFRPRVQGVRVGQEFLMRNSDPFIHNVRSLSLKNRAFNIAQPAGTEDRSRVFGKREGPITIKCDFHRWMTGHLFVMEHPFYAVTGEDGRFEIDGLPDGKYTLAAWHEKFGEKRVEISVRGSELLDFVFEENGK